MQIMAKYLTQNKTSALAALKYTLFSKIYVKSKSFYIS